MLYETLRERGSLGEPKANRSFLFYSSIIELIITTRPIILRKIKYPYKNQYFFKNIIPLSIRVLDLFFLENHDISIVSMFCQKKYYPLVYEFLQNFKIPLFLKKIQKLYKNRDYYRKNRYG